MTADNFSIELFASGILLSRTSQDEKTGASPGLENVRAGYESAYGGAVEPVQKQWINDVLLRAETAAAVLSELCRLYKTFSPKYSLEYLRRASGISSRGHLGDMVRGRRPVSERFADGLCRAFQLNEAQADVLRGLIRFSHAADGKEKDAAADALARSRRTLAVEATYLRPDEMPVFFFAFEAFCTLHLFPSPPTRQEFERYFGEDRRRELDNALRHLLKIGMVAEDEAGRIVRKQTHLVVSAEEGRFPIGFFRSALEDASRRLAVWADKREYAHFEATIISSTKAHLAAVLPEIRKDLLALQTKIDREEGADVLVRFNVQIYPAR